MRRVSDARLDECQDADIIEDFFSPYQAPVVLVIKSNNNKYRFYVDFRMLNQQTIPIFFPIPNLSDLFDTLADAEPEIVSSVALHIGFFKCP